ncbi:hypothetical protein H6F86_08440 [Phormidium sp. FACHB-592]|uniref:Secreted protein n=1 Tax=Stenomitos frigidus AS-A4 TaxID=2933935 RepID=A0ABV0KRC5_9CYAN|nr:hypothetical protein [Phormidium sp. FACHB-592]MBD2073916.1 hypothetical protein [Phormidium sp. FACHB-592]
MKVCYLKLLSLLLSLATLFAAAPVRAESGALDFGVRATDTPVIVAVLPSEESEPLPSDVVESSAPSEPQSPAVSFDPSGVQGSSVATAAPTSAPKPATGEADLFAGGSDSLVARTVGHAEGTRTPNGSKTRAYYGHSDPGNGVWNLGSFSYQHGASSPEAADEKQLRRLERQAEVIRQKADAHRLNLSLEEELNAIDLANQAPLAALDTPGYVDWLKKAHERGLTGSDAVLWARTQSYWNPRRNRWEAPGLGNTEDGISHDQNRRLTAIARALDIYQQQVAARRKEEEPPVQVANKPPEEAVADQIIFQNLSSTSSSEPSLVVVIP